MKYFDGYNEDERPRILGLTASIVDGKVKPNEIQIQIQNLEQILRAACETSNDDDDVERFATKPTELVEVIEDELQNHHLQKVLEPWQDFLNDFPLECISTTSESYKFAKSILKECIETMTTLGASAANRVAEDYLRDIGMLLICLFTCLLVC